MKGSSVVASCVSSRQSISIDQVCTWLRCAVEEYVVTEVGSNQHELAVYSNSRFLEVILDSLAN
jgi:hypothetical protein